MKKNIIAVIVICCLLFPHAAHAQWKYVNPLPFTYDNFSSYFVSDSVGWVGGLDGLINKTTNAGRTWTLQKTNLPESHHILSFCFVSEKIGWAVARVGHILKTIDGGEHWIAQTSGTQKWLYSVNFVSPDTGFITGQEGIALKTTNGGDTWTPLPSTNASILVSQFFDGKRGVAVGGSSKNGVGVFMRTYDGGQTWDSKSLNLTGYTLTSLSFTDSLNGWVVGNEGKVYHTTDGGTNWTATDFNANISPFGWRTQFTCAAFKNNLIGAIGTASDSIYTTVDGGAHWKSLLLKGGPSVSTIVHTNRFMYASGSNGSLYRSDDSGSSIVSLNSGVTDKSLTSAVFIDKTTGWAAGANGTIIKTTDGGTTWRSLKTDMSDSFTSISFGDSLTGLVCGYSGAIQRTTDGGATWNRISIDTSNMTARHIQMTGMNVGFLIGADQRGKGNIYRSGDGGRSWARLTSPDAAANFSSMCFRDSLNGWAMGDSYHEHNRYH